MSDPHMKVIRAELAGHNRCSALGLSASGYAPICMLARKLIRAGIGPELPMEVWRDNVLAVRIGSLLAAARLTVRDDNRGVPRFVQYRVPAFGVSPQERKKEEGTWAIPSIDPSPGVG